MTAALVFAIVVMCFLVWNIIEFAYFIIIKNRNGKIG